VQVTISSGSLVPSIQRNRTG